MYAAYVTELGPAELIRYGPLPEPRPGPTDVGVRVVATTVNVVDTLVRAGLYRTPTPFPFVVGRDLVGTVAAADPVATGFAVGEWVWCASLGHGGRQGAAAEYAVVSADRLYRLPVGVDPVGAVSLFHSAMTAWLVLHRQARLAAGETVYVGGAAGGVGTALVSFAAAAGARVVGSAKPGDEDWCRAAGAAAVVDYRGPGLGDRIREAAPAGVDVYVETSGMHDFDAAVDSLATGGRLVMMAMRGWGGGAGDPTVPVRRLYTRSASMVGFVISLATAADLAAAAAGVNAALAAGTLRPRVAAEVPLSEAAWAHRVVEGSEPAPGRGKVVLRPPGA